MKITSRALLVFAATSHSHGALSLGNLYALKDKDDRYEIVTLENVKSRDIKVTVYSYDEYNDKRIQGSSDPYRKYWCNCETHI